MLLGGRLQGAPSPIAVFYLNGTPEVGGRAPPTEALHWLNWKDILVLMPLEHSVAFYPVGYWYCPLPQTLLFSFWSTVSNLSDSCLSASSNPQTLTFPGVPLCISPTPSVTSCRGHRLFQPGHSPEGGHFGISPSPNLLLQCGAPGVQDRDFTSHLVPTSKSPSPASFAFSILLTPDPSCFPSPTTLALDPGTHA